MEFWIVSAALCLVVGAAVLAVLLRRTRLASQATEYDLRVYRDQLKEVDRDVARRVISAEDAERTRNEVKRRILEADRKAQGSSGPGVAPVGATWIAAGLSILLIGAGAYAVYWEIGALGLPDSPIEERKALAELDRLTRPAQAEIEARISPPPSRSDLDAKELELLEKLRATAAGRPDDLAVQKLLFERELDAENYSAARDVMKHMLDLAGDDATAEEHTRYAQFLVALANGYVSPEAEAELDRALALDPRNGIARYFRGEMFAQTGRPDLAFEIWAQLLAESTPAAPWQQPIRDQIGQVALWAGANDYVPPPIANGPSAEDVEAARAMSSDEQREMIEGMVTGLSERLASEGGPPKDWAQLIVAYGVLGQTEEAAAIWQEAQKVFPDEASRAPILQAARNAGVAE